MDSTSCRFRDIDEAVSTAYKTIWEAEFWRRGSFARARRRAVRNITATNIDVEFFAEANYGPGSIGFNHHLEVPHLLRNGHWWPGTSHRALQQCC